MRSDLSGDGAADIIVTSPWGLGVLALTGPAPSTSGLGGLTLSARTLSARTLSPNGTPLGDWRLDTRANNVELRADMNGDGVGELLMSSPWGIGLLRLTPDGLRSIAMAPNGRRVGGWIVDTRNNQFLHAGDFDGNGRDEVLLTSPWGLGLMNLGSDFGTLMLAPNGTRFGGWLLNTANDSFPLVADLDGDGRPEIVAMSPWGLGVLQYTAGGLRSIAMVPNGTVFETTEGPWSLDTLNDRVELAGDLDGDGRQELVLRNDRGLIVLGLEGDRLRAIAVARSGGRLGTWTFDPVRDRLAAAADFNGDGRARLLIVGDAGLALVGWSGLAWVSPMHAANGTRFGGWLLNTWDNRFNHVADLDGDGRPEILVSSPWGLAVLRFNGAHLDVLAMAANGSRFGGWLLNTADNDLEAGLGQSWGLVIWHPDWTGAVDRTTRFLQGRGFTVRSHSRVEDGLSELRRLALTARPGDRVFVYLAGHGATSRGLADHQRTSALGHILQFGDGAIVRYDRFAPWFRRLGVAGVDLTVFDGSCDGGEAVIAALGERYLALSTTGIHAPGITNTPDPSTAMSAAGRPNSFGLWWSAEPTASTMNAQVPHRFFQKIYRSDETEINELSLFYKPAIPFYLAVGGGWDLMVRRCYLYRYLYPSGFAGLTPADQAAMTGGVDAYLASMRADLQAMAAPIARLRGLLGRPELISRAADVYAAAYPRPWQMLFGAPDWNPAIEPIRLSPAGTPIEPGRYAGHAGFERMVADILRTLDVFAASYREQEGLLRRLDQAIALRELFRGIDQTLRRHTGITIGEHQRYNAFDQAARASLQRIIEDTRPFQHALLRRLDAVPMKVLPPLPVPALAAGPSPALSPRASVAPGLIEMTRAMESDLQAIAERVRVPLISPSVDSLVQRTLALQSRDSVLLDRLFYLLTITEEAISRASAPRVQTGELVSF